MEHLRTEEGQLHGLFEAGFGQRESLGHQARIGAVEPRHIGPDLQQIRLEGGGGQGRAVIGPAPTQGQDAALAVATEEARQHPEPARLGLQGGEAGFDLGHLRPGLQRIAFHADMCHGIEVPGRQAPGLQQPHEDGAGGPLAEAGHLGQH